MEESKYYIYSNKYSFRERQTKHNGKVYDIYFRVLENDNEKQKKLSGFKTKTEAREAYNDFVAKYCVFERRKERPKKDKTNYPSMTVDEAFAKYKEWMEGNCKPSTTYNRIKHYDSYIAPTFGGMKLKELSKESVNLWQDALTKQKTTGKPMSYRYKKSIKCTFNCLLNWCEARYETYNPIPKSEQIRNTAAKKEMEIWTRAEFQQFIETVDVPIFHALFTVMFFTGRRKAEILALTPADVNLKKKTVRINKSVSKVKRDGTVGFEIVPTKAYKDQTLPLADIVIDELKKTDLSGDFVFAGDKPISFSNLTRVFDKYVRKAGVKRIRVHDLRHSFVSMLIHNGVNLTVVADLIGDTLEQVTKTYAHLYTEDREEAIKMLK